MLPYDIELLSFDEQKLEKIRCLFISQINNVQKKLTGIYSPLTRTNHFALESDQLQTVQALLTKVKNCHRDDLISHIVDFFINCNFHKETEIKEELKHFQAIKDNLDGYSSHCYGSSTQRKEYLQYLWQKSSIGCAYTTIKTSIDSLLPFEGCKIKILILLKQLDQQFKKHTYPNSTIYIEYYPRIKLFHLTVKMLTNVKNYDELTYALTFLLQERNKLPTYHSELTAQWWTTLDGYLKNDAESKGEFVQIINSEAHYARTLLITKLENPQASTMSRSINNTQGRTNTDISTLILQLMNDSSPKATLENKDEPLPQELKASTPIFATIRSSVATPSSITIPEIKDTSSPLPSPRNT